MFKRGIYYLLFVSGVGLLLGRLFEFFRGRRVRILYGHNILPPDIEAREVFDHLGFMGTEEFEQKIRYLKKHHDILSLDQAVQMLRTGGIPWRSAVLTFDDGYRSMVQRILPILKKYNLPVAMFLSSGFMDDNQTPWFNRLIESICRAKEDVLPFSGNGQVYSLRSSKEKADAINAVASYVKTVPDSKKHEILGEIEGILHYRPQEYGRLLPMLSWKEAGELAASPLLTLGAHTVTHPILTQMPAAEAFEEIRQGREQIFQNTGVLVRHFAYPNGRADDFNMVLRNFIEEEKFSSACTTEPGENGRDADFFLLRREGFDREPFHLFALRMSGFFDFGRAVRDALIFPRQALKALFYRFIPQSLLFLRQAESRDAVFLTFDDGPNPVSTPKVLDILKEKEAKASFFLSGSEVAQYPDLAKRISMEGHQCASHGWLHERWSHFNFLGLWSDMVRSERIIERACGRNSRLFRPPYGRLTFPLLFLASLRRMRIALWSMNSNDFQKNTAAEIFSVCRLAKAGDVILFHDDNPGLIDVLPKLIDYFHQNGLKCEGLPS